MGVVENDVDALLLLTPAPPQPSAAAALDPMYELELARRRALGPDDGGIPWSEDSV